MRSDILREECADFRVTFTYVVQGIWVGMLIGTVLQTVILFVVVSRTKWQKEVTAIKHVRHTTRNIKRTRIWFCRFGYLNYFFCGDAGYAGGRPGPGMGWKRRAASYPRNEMKC